MTLYFLILKIGKQNIQKVKEREKTIREIG